MKPVLSRSPGWRGGFTLLELLVVMAIVAILAAITVPALETSKTRQFSGEIDQIAGILEQARSYAVAQNTYVWVAFYPYDPSQATPPDGSGDALGIAVFASADGTDPIDWAATPVSITATGTVNGTVIQPIARFVSIKQMAIRTQNYFVQGSGSGQIASLPTVADLNQNGAASLPTFQITVPGIGLSLPSSVPSDAQTSQSISVVQFTPSGQARVSDSPIDAVWIDFQRVKGKNIIDDNDIAALRINGLSGLATLYRK